jgi:hypothetical protein
VEDGIISSAEVSSKEVDQGVLGIHLGGAAEASDVGFGGVLLTKDAGCRKSCSVIPAEHERQWVRSVLEAALEDTL